MEVGLFSDCAVTDVAKNLIGIFLNTRAAGKLPRIKGIEPAKIKKVAMLGGGVMGSGIVNLLLKGGFDAVLWDINDDVINKGVAAVRKTFAYPIKKKKMKPADLDSMIDNQLTTTTNFKDLKDVDLIIEAVLEDMDIKQDIWKKLEGICRPDVIFRDQHLGPPHHRNGLDSRRSRADDRAPFLQPRRQDAIIGNHLRREDIKPDLSHQRCLWQSHQEDPYRCQ